jgi:hypothetical protein
LASGVFFAEEAGIKCLDIVCVVSLVTGIGGSDCRGGCPSPGGCADTILICNTNKTPGAKIRSRVL